MTKIDLGVKYQLEKYYSLEEGIDEVCPELKKDGIISKQSKNKNGQPAAEYDT